MTGRYDVLNPARYQSVDGLPDDITTLIAVFARSPLVRRELDRFVAMLRATYPESARYQNGFSFLLWNWMSLWFATLAVTVEGYEECSRAHAEFADEGIAGLLASPLRQRLRQYRNKIVHPSPILSEHLVQVNVDLANFVPWAGDLADRFDHLLAPVLQGSREQMH